VRITDARRQCFRLPAISPDCTVLIRPIFSERTTGSDQMPGATPQELAAAIVECIDAGARVINLSLAPSQPSTKQQFAKQDETPRTSGGVQPGLWAAMAGQARRGHPGKKRRRRKRKWKWGPAAEADTKTGTDLRSLRRRCMQRKKSRLDGYEWKISFLQGEWLPLLRPQDLPA
jgi:hypothetical protein